MVMVIMKSY